MAAVQSELLIVTPYLIPGKGGTRILTDLRKRGVQVRILTNSLESTQELVAHSGYMHYRVPLLEDGVELYEVRAALGDAPGSGQSIATALDELWIACEIVRARSQAVVHRLNELR
jgi:putative cardiolipin synthase